GLMALIYFRDKGRMNSFGENEIEGLSFDCDGESDFLVRFRSPSRTIHHPQEVWFDPAHSTQFEFAAKISVCCSKMADRGPIGLVNNDRVLVKLSENMSATRGPSFDLIFIGFGNEIHNLQEQMAISIRHANG